MSKDNFFRTDYHTEDYARVYKERRAQAIAATLRLAQLKRCWAIQLKVRNHLLTKQGTPEYDRPAYYYRRGKMMQLEADIRSAEWDEEFYWHEHHRMHGPKPRKTVLVDGVRTKVERA